MLRASGQEVSLLSGKVEVQFVFPLHGVWSLDQCCRQRFTEEETEAQRGLLWSNSCSWPLGGSMEAQSGVPEAILSPEVCKLTMPAPADLPRLSSPGSGAGRVSVSLTKSQRDK